VLRVPDANQLPPAVPIAAINALLTRTMDKG